MSAVSLVPQLSSLRECLREAEAERDCLEAVLKELGGVQLNSTICSINGTTDDLLDFPGQCFFFLIEQLQWL